MHGASATGNPHVATAETAANATNVFVSVHCNVGEDGKIGGNRTTEPRVEAPEALHADLILRLRTITKVRPSAVFLVSFGQQVEY